MSSQNIWATGEQPYDYSLLVASGQIANYEFLHKFGRTPAGTSFTDLWSAATAHVTPTAARIHDISSLSANDTNAAGTGARQIQIFGLGDLWQLQSEIVNLAGLGVVQTALAYRRIYRMNVIAAGALQTNDNIISAIAQVDGTRTAEIPIRAVGNGYGNTLMAIYTTAANESLYVFNYFASTVRDGGGSGNNSLEASLRIRDVSVANPTWRTLDTGGLQSRGSSAFEKQSRAYLRITPMTDIKISIDFTNTSLECSGSFDGYRILT